MSEARKGHELQNRLEAGGEPMETSTCSGAISLSREMENESVKSYQELSKRFERDKDLFLAFAKESSKYVNQIERAYDGVITDAVEGCFAFYLKVLLVVQQRLLF